MDRYVRQTTLADFGIEGQQKLRAASVLIVGAGGIGSPTAVSLAAMGVGRLVLVDFDTVSESNLHRQFYFKECDTGRTKVDVLQEFIHLLNSQVKVESINTSISLSNIDSLVSDIDVVVDGSDNFPTKYLLNDYCFINGLPLVYGAVDRFEAQITTFDAKVSDIHLRDIFPEMPTADTVGNCATNGVIGGLPALIGQWMSLEVVKVITGIGQCLYGKLMTCNIIDNRVMTFTLRKHYSKPIVLNPSNYIIATSCEVDTITPDTLLQWLSDGLPMTLCDVRTISEHQAGSLGGINIPLDEIANFVADEAIEPIVCYCQKGSRSASAVALLRSKYPSVKIYSLLGGIDKMNLNEINGTY